ncbi:TetR/AcrR family transcriptional regulator [Jatrophihabitans sp. YIM 134969]
MVGNPARRTALTDAGIAVLARDGARGLTHRAVDAEAGVPVGTTGNYFRSRADLLEALVARIFERLAPEPEVLASFARRRPSRARFADQIRDIVRRLLLHRDDTVALFELRIEAARRPEVAAVMTPALVGGFQADLAYHAEARLPGGPAEIALFHYAVDGLLLDLLTVSIGSGTAPDDVVDVLVERLLPRGRAVRA